MDWRLTSIDDAHLSNRAQSRLKSDRYQTMGDVDKAWPAAIMRIPGLGRRCWAEIEQWMIVNAPDSKAALEVKRRGARIQTRKDSRALKGEAKIERLKTRIAKLQTELAAEEGVLRRLRKVMD